MSGTDPLNQDTRDYIRREVQSRSFFGGFPRWVLVAIALWIAVIETADKLPQIFLALPRYQAAMAEAQAKLLQPDLMAAQVKKAQFDAQTAGVQLERAQAETITAKAAATIAAELTTAQLAKAQNDAKTSALQPQQTQMQMAKLGLDTQVVIATLPNTQAGAAMAQQMFKIMGPWMGVLGGMIPTPQQAELISSNSQDYQDAVKDAHSFDNFRALATNPEAQEGIEYWVKVKEDRSHTHTCREGKGARSAEFRAACDTTRESFNRSDARYMRSPNYKAGWDSVFPPK